MTTGPIVFEDSDRLTLIDLGLRRLMVQVLVVVGVLFGGLRLRKLCVVCGHSNVSSSRHKAVLP